MLFLLLFIFIVLFILGVIIDKNSSYDNSIGEFLGWFSLGFILLIMIALTFVIVDYPRNIDEKLNMYEEENQSIELKVKETVKVYMDYEQETYKNLVETTDLTALLIKYPELNSNELVKHEIEIYKSNSDKIKELKEKQIDRSSYNWWLYFGN